jgi:hypothetical protein
MLHRSTDRLCRCGVPMNNPANGASFKSLDKDAPSRLGPTSLAESVGGAIAFPVTGTIPALAQLKLARS